MGNVIYEDFNSIKELMDAINSRPKNYIMRSKNSSTDEGNAEWYGTSNWDEAIKLLKYGYTDPIKKIKEGLSVNKSITSKFVKNMPRPRPRNHIIGYIPNVPNALMGLPQSMITVDKQNQKRKTASILYCFGSCAMTNKNALIGAGIALVTAINIIELSGIQTRLNVIFMPAQAEGEIYYHTSK